MSHSPDLHVLKHMEMVEHMKKDEIDYKALYENALEGAKNGKCIKDIFPELAESEDEKIRKHIIEILSTLSPCHFDGNEKSECIAWLEKKGEQKQNPCEDCNHATLNCSNFPCEEKKSYNGEQKSADKIEPKFKVGDWITNGILLAGQVTSFDGEYYRYMCGGLEQPLHVSNAHKWHLWTIQDAKDGDVLAVEYIIFIYKRILGSHIVSYCKLVNDIFEHYEDGRTCCEGNSNVHPATKEQRDLLFQKMKEAGYEWDEGKKVLEKIEQKPAWSEEDDIMKQNCHRMLALLRPNSSELTKDIIDNCHHWLKSLKERMIWRPTEEQMSYLDRAIEQFDFCDPEHAALEAIYTHFKKLQNQ